MSEKSTDPEFEKDNVILSDQVKQTLADDPELAAVFRQIAALMRQAHAAWQAGQYPTFEDAARALGLEPEPLGQAGAGHCDPHTFYVESVDLK